MFARTSLAGCILTMLVPVCGQAITKGPYLQSVTENSVRIFWETEAPATGTVYYGLLTADEDSIAVPEPETMHKVTIAGLSENTTYQYCVSSGGQSSEVYSFKTAGDKDTPFRMVLFGDNRYGSSNAWQLWNNDKIISNIATFRPDILVNTGDLTNDDLEAGWVAFFEGHRSIFAQAPIYASMGNHDGMPGMLKYLDNANRFVSSGGRIHHAARYNGIQFVFAGDQYEYTAEEANWIRSTIERAENDGLYQTIVVMHYPPYNCSRHGNGGDAILPIIAGCNSVHFVFSGHSHNYQRNYADGRYYLVSGGAGAGIYSEDNHAPFNQVFVPVKHHVEIEVDGWEMSFRAVDYTGTVVDSFSVVIPHDPTSAVNENAAEDTDASFGVFPNPFNPWVAVWLKTAEAAASEQIHLEVFDVHGKAVKQMVVSGGRLHEGVVISMDDMPAGVYLLKAETNTRKYVRKIQLIK